MSTQFPGLLLSPPLFYRWPVGIRFELGVEEAGTSYDDVVLARACALYEATFQADDFAFIVSGKSISPNGAGFDGPMAGMPFAFPMSLNSPESCHSGSMASPGDNAS